MLSGIRDILIITTPRDIGAFESLFKDGSDLGLNIQYQVQDKPRGIPEAFIIGEKFIQNEPVCLILGDNIFYGEGIPAYLKGISQLKTGLVYLDIMLRIPNVMVLQN